MPISPQKLKDKLSDFRRLFLMETSVFDKLVVIFKYFRYLSSEPLAKELLQKIFDDALVSGIFVDPKHMSEEEFDKIDTKEMYSKNFWIYLNNLQNIHNRMKKLKECKLQNREEYEEICQLYSKPYSEDALNFSIRIINDKIFEKISEDKFVNEEEDKTWFDEKRGLLFLKGGKVQIDKQDKTTNAHKILKYIFIDNKDNLSDDFFYSEIAEKE